MKLSKSKNIVSKKVKSAGRYLKKLNWFERLLLIAPIALWFSWQPRIQLGNDGTMYYRLSLALIYVAILAVVAIPTVWRGRRDLMKSHYVWLITAFTVWSGITVVWSVNQRRGILTFGVTGALYLIFLAIWSERERIRRLLPLLVKILLVSTTVVCVLALVQVVAGALIPGGQQVGLCRGCVAGQFGFVRPNVFAIEPQFLGSLLLAPLLTMSYRLAIKHNGRDNIQFLLFATVLVLTMSRGAIYAYSAALVILLVFTKTGIRRKLAVVCLGCLAAIIGLTIQGVAAQVNPYIDTNFYQAISSSVNHLSLGKISLPEKKEEARNVNKGEVAPAFTGYVTESTNIRTNLSRVALTAWWKAPAKNKIAGTGLGSAGVVMARETGSSYQREIVQNEYVEVLLERGIIGLVLLLAVILATFYELRPHEWCRSLLVAYLIQYLFFSGLPNALHVYLTLDSALTGKDLPDRFEEDLDI